MFISDLSYLAEVPQTSGLVGSRGRTISPYIVQYNKAVVTQKAIASSSAFAYGGDAYAFSFATNVVDIDQNNA